MSGGDVTAREARLKEIAELIFKSERSARLVIRGTPYELASAVDWLMAELEAAEAARDKWERSANATHKAASDNAAEASEQWKRAEAAEARTARLWDALLDAREAIVNTARTGFDSTRGEIALAALGQIDAALSLSDGKGDE